MTRSSWSSNRSEIAYKETRAILEEQQEAIRDIDDKALRTSRLSVILVGAMISALSGNFVELNPWLVGFAGVLFFLSFIWGLRTYLSTDVYIAPKNEYIKRLQYGELDTAPWDYSLLTVLQSLVDQNQNYVDVNEDMIETTQTFLVAGVILAGFSAVF